ncbi:hypothetical protein [Mycobacterium sp. SMC-4]|uniref:hypothetical protein n=1 Tax=Mycobacterium sp. SMC-4 TaxID=2857059 RepID=UPI0021B419A4|nr:hypothetical protein [Mycobacterium sp. SMC-4]UXA17968.1 hypothetical protein KXD98_25415 [Mycobacterium sp. SMC-4]
MPSAQLTGRHRRSGGSVWTRPRLALTASMVAAGFAGWLGATVTAAPSAAPPVHGGSGASVTPVSMAMSHAPEASVAPREFERSGQIVSVSSDALTTAADGQLSTFRITPQTARITMPGADVFTPAQNVVVLGIVHEGVAFATAIADRRAVGPDGPPMDYQLPA